MKKCLIVGAGTYGEVYAQYLKEEYEIIGFIDDDFSKHGSFINGIEILGDFDSIFVNFERSINVFVPIGNNKVRVEFLEKLQYSGYSIPSFIHTTTDMHQSVQLGSAVYVLGNTNVMPCSIIEDFVMISMGVNIAHHTILKKGCFLSQGSNIGASIEVSENAFCGIGATIMTGVNYVGKNSLIGAGSVVIRDVPDGAVVVGNPGKVIKYNLL